MIFSLLLVLSVAHACTNLLVSKGASADGSVIVAYNADDDALFGSLDHRPAAVHAPGSKKEIWDCACATTRAARRTQRAARCAPHAARRTQRAAPARRTLRAASCAPHAPRRTPLAAHPVTRHLSPLLPRRVQGTASTTAGSSTRCRRRSTSWAT
jgi:hypothetical protein